MGTERIRRMLVTRPGIVDGAHYSACLNRQANTAGEKAAAFVVAVWGSSRTYVSWRRASVVAGGDEGDTQDKRAFRLPTPEPALGDLTRSKADRLNAIIEKNTASRVAQSTVQFGDFRDETMCKRLIPSMSE